MADAEKRLRVSVDTSQLRTVGGELDSVQRKIVENNNDILQQQGNAINQLREQLNLLERQNSERDRQTPAAPVRPVQPEQQEEEQTPARRRRRTKQDQIDELRGQIETYQTGGARAIDLQSLLNVNGEGFEKMIEAITSGAADLSDITKQILQNVQTGTRALEAIQEGIFSIDESLYNQGSGVVGGGSGVAPIVPVVPPVRDEEESQITRERRESAERGSDRSVGTNIATRVISAGGVAVQSPAQMGGTIISTAGGVLGEGLSMIPGVGGFLGGIATAIGNVAGSIFTTTVEKYFEISRRMVPYSQTMGTSAGESFRQSYREGSYAASALGMNVGEYMERRAALIRAAGGKEETVAPVRETQSLMAVQRLYGLSDQTVMGMQGAMRFATDEQGQTTSSSAVIRSFEQTMKQLQIPLSEIASTMDESMSTFIRSADDILSRTGEIDAASIASIMRAVRLQTGMEGRQLERVQQTFMGEGISQDEVTQTLLFRAAQQATGAQTPSEVFAAMENLPKNPEIMRNMLDYMQQYSGGSLEMMRNLMAGAFKNLSWTDIKDLTQNGMPNFDELFKRIQQSEEALRQQNDEVNRYEPTAAQRTVSVAERTQAELDNKLSAWGAENIKKLFDILNEINRGVNNVSAVKELYEGLFNKMKDAFSKGDQRTANMAAFNIANLPGLFMRMGAENLWEKIKEEF